MTGDASLEALLQRARALGVDGDLPGAEALLEQALAGAPDDPRVLHLLGVTRWQAGRPESAHALLERAAELTPERAEAWYVLGKVKEALAGAAHALGAWERSVALAPGLAPAWADLGVARAETGALAGAVDALERARALGHAGPGVLYTLGQALRGLDRAPEAVSVLREALRASPDDGGLLHALGLALQATGAPGEARGVLERAAERTPDDADVHLDLAAVLDELDDTGAALASLRRAVAADPASPRAHDALNRALWEAGAHGEHLASYAAALGTVARPGRLRRDYARWLVRAERWDDARVQLEAALADGGDAECHRLMARCLANTGDAAGAVAQFRHAVARAPDDPAARRDLARMLIMLGEVDAALEQVEAARALAPEDQEAIAYQGLCWRLAGDPREAALNDYRRLVRTYRIAVPPGPQDLAAFNRALADELDGLHRGTVHPVDQTLRGGTQTHGDLFARELPAVQALRAGIERCVGEYIDAMGDDPAHPLAARRGGGFRFAASWSCRLRAQGFHTNHLHPKGWISSCYYVSLPEAVRSGGDRQGWITFGESNLRLGEREHEGRAVQPEEGLLVLFPSYMFHGTVPFESEQPRLTVAFDVVPDD